VSSYDRSASQIVRRRAARVLAAAIAVAGLAGGAQGEKVTAIRAAWIIDATGRPPIHDGTLVVTGRTITAVGPSASVKVPEGADVVDLPNQTVLPGLIDTHSHLAVRIAEGGVQSIQAQRSAPAERQMLTMLRNARVQLLCGVTTLRQCGDAYFNDIKIRDAAAAGLHPAPRIVSAGWPITNSGGHGIPAYWFDGPAAVREAVRRNVREGAEWIKLLSTDVTPASSEMALDDMKAAVDEAHRLGVKVTVHATGRWGSAMRPLTSDLIRLMLHKGTTVSLTPLVYIGWRPTRATWTKLDTGVDSGEEWMTFLTDRIAEYRQAHADQETQDRPYEDNEPGRASRDMFQGVKNVQRQYLEAFRAGLPFSLGSDGIYGAVAPEIEFLVEAGVPPMDAIRAATAVAARLIGYGDRLGTLEPGKWADVISVEGNPLARIGDIRRVRFIMRDGIRYDRLSWR
jgi:imidazolonepropionase-like amidohydrolase